MNLYSIQYLLQIEHMNGKRFVSGFEDAHSPNNQTNVIFIVRITDWIITDNLFNRNISSRQQSVVEQLVAQKTRKTGRLTSIWRNENNNSYFQAVAFLAIFHFHKTHIRPTHWWMICRTLIETKSCIALHMPVFFLLILFQFDCVYSARIEAKKYFYEKCLHAPLILLFECRMAGWMWLMEFKLCYVTLRVFFLRQT